MLDTRVARALLFHLDTSDALERIVRRVPGGEPLAHGRPQAAMSPGRLRRGALACSRVGAPDTDAASASSGSAARSVPTTRPTPVASPSAAALLSKWTQRPSPRESRSLLVWLRTPAPEAQARDRESCAGAAASGVRPPRPTPGRTLRRAVSPMRATSE